MNHSHKDHRDRQRLEKIQLKDHLYRASQVPILEAEAEDFWARLLTLNERQGNLGPYQLWHEHMPKWDKFQLHHGTPCPGYLRPDHAPRVTELHQKVKAALDRAAVSPHTLTTEAVLQAVHMQAGTV